MDTQTKEVISNARRWHVQCADVLDYLQSLPDGCVHCICTSPPYYGLRDYGISGQIGLEVTPQQYVQKLTEVFREARRVLHDSGVCWLNLGDTYAGGGGGNYSSGTRNASGQNPANVRNRQDWMDKNNLKAKDLIGIPWLVAFALRDDGWYLRSAPPWIKGNSMPESVTDRVSTGHEYWFMLSKQPHYFWDSFAISLPAEQPVGMAQLTGQKKRGKLQSLNNSTLGTNRGAETRNRRTSDWWCESIDELIQYHRARLAHLTRIRDNGGIMLDNEGKPVGLMFNTMPLRESHFATFSPRMVDPIVRGSTSEHGVCPACASPWMRMVQRKRRPTRPALSGKMVERAIMKDSAAPGAGKTLYTGNRDPQRHCTIRRFLGWQPSCKCQRDDVVPAVVLDPFAGAGTTVMVANRLDRRGIGCELNHEYVEMARQRIANDDGLTKVETSRDTAGPLFEGLTP